MKPDLLWTVRHAGRINDDYTLYLIPSSLFLMFEVEKRNNGRESEVVTSQEYLRVLVSFFS